MSAESKPKAKRFLPFRFTPISHYFIDQQMADLDPSAVVVLLCLAREAYSNTQNSGRCSLTIEQIAKGKPSATRGTGLSRSTIKRAIDTLIEAGLVNKEEFRDESGVNLPNLYYLLFDDGEDGHVEFEGRGSTHEPQGSVDEPQEGSTHEPLLENTPERSVQERIENNPLPPSEETQEQNTSAEEEHWADAATAASMLLSYLRVAKAPGLIKANSNSARVAIMENLARRLKGHQVLSDRIGPVVDFFCNWYLSRPSDDKPHYVSIVGGKFLDMLTGDASLDTDPPDLPSTSVSLPPIDLQPISPKSPPDIPPASPHNGLPPLALRWNEVVHSGPPVVAWKEQSNGDFLLRTLMSDPVFQRESETALAKAEKLCAAKHPKGSYLTFGWFIKPGKWCEVLNGQHDWLLGDGPAQQPKKGMGALIEQFKAECEAKKGDKNLDSHVE
jgi:hypothetical protein